MLKVFHLRMFQVKRNHKVMEALKQNCKVKKEKFRKFKSCRDINIQCHDIHFHCHILISVMSQHSTHVVATSYRFPEF